MTKERIDAISQALVEDEKQIPVLFEMEPEEAAKKLNEKGYDFTKDELMAYAEILEQEAKEKNGEIEESALEGVAGGSLVGVALGIAVGYWLGSRVGRRW